MYVHTLRERNGSNCGLFLMEINGRLFHNYVMEASYNSCGVQGEDIKIKRKDSWWREENGGVANSCGGGAAVS